MRSAFRNFDGHLAVITEQVEADDVSDIDTCEGYQENVTANLVRHQVNEVKIYGDIETGSLVLRGVKILKRNEEIKLNTPKQALDDNDYNFINELVAATQRLVDEITEYHNGKQRPEQQMDMFKEAAKEEENQ